MEQPPMDVIIRYLSQQASEEECRQVLQWAEANPAHRLQLEEFTALWKNDSLPASKYNVQQAWTKINTIIEEEENDKAASRSATITPLWRIAAAAVFMLLSVTGIFLIMNRSQEAPVLLTVTAAYGEKVSVQLSDGTTVSLNSGSTLSYPETFSDSIREVQLSGEAFFEVMRDEQHPFQVKTAQTTTRVLGTSFAIREEGEEVTVAVATGKVKVSASTHQLLLTPYQKVTWNGHTQHLQKDSTSLDAELAWNQNTLHFENESMKDVARTLEKWYGVTVKLENDALASCLLSGRFKNHSLPQVLRAIEYSLGVTCRVQDKQVTISGTGCK